MNEWVELKLWTAVVVHVHCWELTNLGCAYSRIVNKQISKEMGDLSVTASVKHFYPAWRKNHPHYATKLEAKQWSTFLTLNSLSKSQTSSSPPPPPSVQKVRIRMVCPCYFSPVRKMRLFLLVLLFVTMTKSEILQVVKKSERIMKPMGFESLVSTFNSTREARRSGT